MKTYKSLEREFLSEYVDLFRKKRKLTQEEMAENLRITCRSYGDLERGKYCFSSNSLFFLLLMLNEHELKAFLTEFRNRICILENSEKKSADFGIPMT